MTRAEELQALRKERGYEAPKRHFETIEGADTLESYYEKVLSDAELEEALRRYGDDFTALSREFLDKTRLHTLDLGVLFLATVLQCVRIFIVNRWINEATVIEKANMKNSREDRLHQFQERILKPFGGDGKPYVNALHAPLETILMLRGVPYDATRYGGENLHLFKGANHRFSTLGHDPVLGLIFGTANILTSTITTNRKLLVLTHHVQYDPPLRNPRIAGPVSTLQMLLEAAQRVDGDLKSVVAALIKQLIHIGTDLYTPCGISLPGAQLVLSNKTVDRLTKHVSMGGMLKFGASTSIDAFFNAMIAVLHRVCFRLDDTTLDEGLLEARTRKIILYSNLIASSSNLIATAITKDVRNLDVSGIVVTLGRLFIDTRFIRKLQCEFINSGLNQRYRDRYAAALAYETMGGMHNEDTV